VDKSELIDYVRQNSVLKERLDELTAIQSDVKKNLKQGIEELGEADDRGHIIVEIDDEVSGIARVMNQKRVSKTLDIEVAEKLLTERGIHDRCITMVPVLNEDEIMAAFYEGAISEEDIDTMFPAKVTWALVMK
jgi:REP element-mobilizing transposase RayT